MSGEENGQAFIAMEFLDGRMLKDYSASRPLSLAQVLDLGGEIAKGLDAAHQLGIVHRDIKPAIIFATKRGHTKILDFGLPKLNPKPVDEVTVTADATSGPAEIELTMPGIVLDTTASHPSKCAEKSWMPEPTSSRLASFFMKWRLVSWRSKEPPTASSRKQF